ncbi:MAG: MoaD/ThiS family protein, partial [Marinomonas sp.]
ILLEEKVKAAIDFDFARDDDLVDPAKVRELAFFPPVTGG